MAQSTRDSIKDILRTTLDNLGQKELNHFKRLLNEYSQQRKSGAHVIPWGKLENTDEFETVNLIVQVYTETCSGGVVVNVLKTMKLNQMAEDLEKELNTETTVSASPGRRQMFNKIRFHIQNKQYYWPTTNIPSTFLQKCTGLEN